jgi:hypothetical protein
VRETRNNSNQQQGPGGGQRRRRNRYRGGGGGGSAQGQPRSGAEGRNRDFQSSSRRRPGRTLTSNQVLVKYDNLLEQHLITRRKYYEYFNRVDDRQLRRLEKNFFASIEHLRRFEASLEPWQREALEKRKTERYKLDLTYSLNRNLDPSQLPQVEISAEEIEDPHFTDSQKEAFDAYKEDTEESEGSYEDYLKLKGLN